MAVDYDRLFASPAFESISADTLAGFKRLVKSLEGKELSQAAAPIMNFYKNIPKNEALTPEQQQAVMEAILSSMNSADRKKFQKMLILINELSQSK